MPPPPLVWVDSQETVVRVAGNLALVDVEQQRVWRSKREAQFVEGRGGATVSFIDAPEQSRPANVGVWCRVPGGVWLPVRFDVERDGIEAHIVRPLSADTLQIHYSYQQRLQHPRVLLLNPTCGCMGNERWEVLLPPDTRARTSPRFTRRRLANGVSYSLEERGSRPIEADTLTVEW